MQFSSGPEVGPARVMPHAGGAPRYADVRGPALRGPRALDTAAFEQQWPALAAALGQYQRHTAEAFCETVYAAISHGLLRFDQRTALAQRAQTLGIRQFDAQLLIACAVRQWALDHGQHVAPAPVVAADRDVAADTKARTRQRWLRFFIMLLLALALDAALVFYYIK